MNTLVKIGAVMAGTCVPLFGVGCSLEERHKPIEVKIVRVPRSEPLPERTEEEIEEDYRKQFLNGEPLANYRDKVEGLPIFDENENNAIEPKEARKYAMVMFDKNEDGKLDIFEIDDIEEAAKKLWNKYEYPTRQVTGNIMRSATSFYSIYDEELARITEENLKAKEEKIKAKIKEYEASHPVKAEAVSESDFEEIGR